MDIEVVTPGTSIVNNTINYTTQPSSKKDWSPIPGATLSVPLENTLDTFRTHRFDCDVTKGVKYYLDDKLMHTDNHNIPKAGGSLQLKLWADGNKWWSGMPSSTDTYLRVKNIVAYYNTSASLADKEWHDKCHKEKKQCKAVMKVSLVDYPNSMLPIPNSPSSCIGAMECPTGIGADPSPGSTVTHPTYTGYTIPKITPPSVGGPRTSGSSRISLSMWTIGGVCVGIVIMAVNLG